MNNEAHIYSAYKVAAFFGLFCLAVLLVSFVSYRIEHPSLTKERQAPAKASNNPMGDMTALMKRLEKNPQDKEALYKLGHRFMRMQAWDKALQFWNRFLRLQPENKSVLTQKGFCLFQKDKFAKAAGTFKKVLQMDSKDYRAHYNLGMLYKHYLEKPDLGRKHLRKVLEFLPPEKNKLQKEVQKELSRKNSEG